MAERDWASLERGVLRDIFVRLPDIDAMRFRRVCPNWRVAAGDGAGGALVPRPWFILNPADDEGGYGQAHAFVRPEDHRRHARVRSVPAADSTAVTRVWPPARVRGTSRGWLAVEEDERLLLRDPISGAEIPLPAFDAAGYQMFDVFLSDDPLGAPGGSWTAFAFFRWGNVCTQNPQNPGPGDVLAFCRAGDAEWARVDPVDVDGQQGQHTRRYRGLEFFGGKPYVLLAETRTLAVCDVEARRLVVSSVWIHTPPVAESAWQECLVECGGELLVVQVARTYEHRSPWYCPAGYRLCSRHFLKDKIRYYAVVFTIVFDNDGSGMPVLAVESPRSTGDYAVFVAPQGHAFALRASDFPDVREGCVYFFPVNNRKKVQGMVVIDLPTRRDKIVRKLPLEGNWRILSWFCPRCPVLDATPPPRRSRCLMHGLRKS